MFHGLVLMLTVMALALGYGSCAALFAKLHRTADAILISAFGVAVSMLLVSLGSAYVDLLAEGV